MRLILYFGALGIWLALWALLVQLTGWFEWRGQTFLIVPFLGLGYAAYSSRACGIGLDPARCFRQLGKVAAILGAIAGAILAEGATFMGSYGGKVFGLSLEGAFVGALGGLISGFATAVVGQAILGSAAHSKPLGATPNATMIIQLKDAERERVLVSLDYLSQHLGGFESASEQLPADIPHPNEVLRRVQSKTVEPKDLKLIVNTLGLYRWFLKHHYMGTFQGMPYKDRFHAEAAEVEHVALSDLCVRLCDKAAERGVSVPDLSGTLGFF